MTQEAVGPVVMNRKPSSLGRVEAAIRKNRIFSSEIELWKYLSKQIPYSTIKRYTRFLEKHNKIMRNKDGSIIWIHVDSPEAKKSLEESIRYR